MKQKVIETLFKTKLHLQKIESKKERKKKVDS